MKQKINKETFNKILRFFELNKIMLVDEGESTLTNIQIIDEDWLFDELNNYLGAKE